MKLRNTYLLPAVILGSSLFGVSVANAAELPKEGTYGGIYIAYATEKPLAALDKERTLISFEENGLPVGKGFTDHMTWHCFGLIDIVKGTGQNNGRCVGTDPAGDQAVFEFATEKFSPEKMPNPLNVNVKITSGSGKYTGITGGHLFKVEIGSSKSTAEGTSFSYGTFEGNYKLP